MERRGEEESVATVDGKRFWKKKVKTKRNIGGLIRMVVN
jgi:hypothetical protein